MQVGEVVLEKVPVDDEFPIAGEEADGSGLEDTVNRELVRALARRVSLSGS